MAKHHRSIKQSARRVTWEPREGLDRPTAERRNRGVFTMVDGENAGESYAQDMACDPVSALKEAGRLTPQQAEAAYRYEDLARAAMGSPSSKDSIAALHRVDCERSGEDYAPSPAEERTQKEWRDLVTMLNRRTQIELLNVCWEHKPTRAINILRVGLDIVADFYKI